MLEHINRLNRELTDKNKELDRQKDIMRQYDMNKKGGEEKKMQILNELNSAVYQN